MVVRLAQENITLGYDQIVGALAILGYTVSDQTVGNIFKGHGIPSALDRKTTATWHEFIRTHMDVLIATDFSPLRRGRSVGWSRTTCCSYSIRKVVESKSLR